MPSGIASSLTVGAWQHPLPDGLNSVRGVVSDALTVLETVTYTPYGVPDTALTATDFAFTGEMRDANGLQYHRARYYDPALAVWGSLDPFEGVVGRPMSLNGYSWVEGNTLNALDPTGLQLCDLGYVPDGYGGCIPDIYNNISPIPGGMTVRPRIRTIPEIAPRTPEISVPRIDFSADGNRYIPNNPAPRGIGGIGALLRLSMVGQAMTFGIPTQDSLGNVCNAYTRTLNPGLCINVNSIPRIMHPDDIWKFVGDICVSTLPNLTEQMALSRSPFQIPQDTTQGIVNNIAALEGFLTPELELVEEVTDYSEQDLNQMRIQIQRNVGEDYSVVAIALPDVGVSTLQIRTGMEAMYNTLSIGATWIPRNKYRDVYSAIIRMSERLNGFVAGGGVAQGGQIAQEIIQRPRFRLDLENIRGHNLRY